MYIRRYVQKIFYRWICILPCFSVNVSSGDSCYNFPSIDQEHICNHVHLPNLHSLGELGICAIHSVIICMMSSLFFFKFLMWNWSKFFYANTTCAKASIKTFDLTIFRKPSLIVSLTNAKSWLNVYLVESLIPSYFQYFPGESIFISKHLG